MVKKIILFLFVLISIFIITIFLIPKNKEIKIDDSAVSILINKYLDEEKYINILIYSLNNINYISKIFDVLNYRYNNLNSTIYSQIDKINILKTIIVINNSLNHDFYKKLEQNIIELSNRNYSNIDEYLSVLDLFNNIIKNKELDLDFLELLAYKNTIIINDFIKEYYNDTKSLNSFVYNRYIETYKNYLDILELKYNIDGDKINNINNLKDNELKYALVKQNINKYKESNTNSLLIPATKITGKTILYYQFSKLFKKSSISTGIKVIGGVDVGTDAFSLYKKINYMLYAEKIHKTNRINSIYMTKYDKLYYYISSIYINIVNSFEKNNVFKNYTITNDNKDNIDKIKTIELNKTIAKISIANKTNIEKTLSKYNEKGFLSFIDDIIIKNKKEKDEALEKDLMKKHQRYINKLKFYQKFLLDTCI